MPKQTSTNKRNRSAADLDGDSDVEDLDKVLPGKVVDKAAHDTFMRSAGYVPVPSAPFVPGHCFFDALRHSQLLKAWLELEKRGRNLSIIQHPAQRRFTFVFVFQFAV